jgi:hypothetical protein
MDDILNEPPDDEQPKLDKCHAEDYNAAIHGQRLPPTLESEVTRLCVIHGIGHHYGFAQELRGLRPEFTRALNARDIMSGVIPVDMKEPDEVPYCIWHPGLPSEDTLRALVQRYAIMIYHVARACAVTGYISLYMELSTDILPEVHVAEEACHASAGRNIKGSEDIYQLIMTHRTKHAVMNGYEDPAS